MTRILQVALLAFLLAGCSANSPPDGPGESGTGTASQTSSTSPGNVPIVIPPGANWTAEIRADGCTEAGVAMDYPFPLAETAVPAGWEPRQDVTNVDLGVLRCQRISTGPFERGPISLALNYHNAAEFPDQCQQGDFGVLRVLHGLWVNDTEVAAWLHQAYGMPAFSAVFSYTENVVLGDTTKTWQITPDGAATSEIVMDDPEQENLGSALSVTRLFWPNAIGGVSYYNFADDHTIDNVASPARGRLASPFLNNIFGVEDFVSARAAIYRDVGISGPIVQFKDTQCAEPL